MPDNYFTPPQQKRKWPNDQAPYSLSPQVEGAALQPQPKQNFDWISPQPPPLPTRPPEPMLPHPKTAGAKGLRRPQTPEQPQVGPPMPGLWDELRDKGAVGTWFNHVLDPALYNTGKVAEQGIDLLFGQGTTDDAWKRLVGTPMEPQMLSGPPGRNEQVEATTEGHPRTTSPTPQAAPSDWQGILDQRKRDFWSDKMAKAGREAGPYTGMSPMPGMFGMIGSVAERASRIGEDQTAAKAGLAAVDKDRINKQQENTISRAGTGLRMPQRTTMPGYPLGSGAGGPVPGRAQGGSGFGASPMASRANAALSSFMGRNVGQDMAWGIDNAMRGSQMSSDMWQRQKASDLNDAAIRRQQIQDQMMAAPQLRAAEMLKSMVGTGAEMTPQGQALMQHLIGVMQGGQGQAQAATQPPTAPTAGVKPPDKGGGAGAAFAEGLLPGALGMAPWLIPGGGVPGMTLKIAGSAGLPIVANKVINWLDPYSSQEHPTAYGAGAATGAGATYLSGRRMRQEQGQPPTPTAAPAPSGPPPVIPPPVIPTTPLGPPMNPPPPAGYNPPGSANTIPVSPTTPGAGVGGPSGGFGSMGEGFSTPQGPLNIGGLEDLNLTPDELMRLLGMMA